MVPKKVHENKRENVTSKNTTNIVRLKAAKENLNTSADRQRKDDTSSRKGTSLLELLAESVDKNVLAQSILQVNMSKFMDLSDNSSEGSCDDDLDEETMRSNFLALLEKKAVHYFTSSADNSSDDECSMAIDNDSIKSNSDSDLFSAKKIIEDIENITTIENVQQIQLRRSDDVLKNLEECKTLQTIVNDKERIEEQNEKEQQNKEENDFLFAESNIEEYGNISPMDIAKENVEQIDCIQLSKSEEDDVDQQNEAEKRRENAGIDDKTRNILLNINDAKVDIDETLTKLNTMPIDTVDDLLIDKSLDDSKEINTITEDNTEKEVELPKSEGQGKDIKIKTSKDNHGKVEMSLIDDETVQNLNNPTITIAETGIIEESKQHILADHDKQKEMI